MIQELITIADAMAKENPERGAVIAQKMRTTLEKGMPYNGGLEEAMKYFGKYWEAAIALAAPTVVALDGMIPGFKVWVEKTKFNEDKMMLEVLIEMSNYLNQYRRPSDARMRPASVPLPRHF